MSDPTNSLEDRIVYMQENIGNMMMMAPWANELGFSATRVERGHVWGIQPYDEKLTGNADDGVIHGGVITTFLDNLCGSACMVSLEEMRFVATLDLRIDYMRPAERGRDILGEAECYHVTRSVAFCRAWAYHESREKVIATAQGAFAINKPRPQSDREIRL